jgi:hypothetical protein
MSCEFLKSTSEILIQKLSPKYQFEILDILPQEEEYGQDYDEVVLYWSDPIYAGGLNEMFYYIRLSMDEVIVCLDQMELFSITDPEFDNLDNLSQEIINKLNK